MTIEDRAEAIVRLVLHDLSDRKGIGNVLEDVDSEIMSELILELREIVEGVLRE